MKKILLLAALIFSISAPVQARPFHHGSMHHRSHPTIIYKTHHKHSTVPLVALASGLVGFAVGTVASTPVIYTTPSSNSRHCYTVISKSTGNITQHCISNTNTDNQLVYVD